MRRADCLRLMARRHTDELVVCTLGRTAAEWYDENPKKDDQTFFMRSSMGLVSSMALGLALALPHRRIWALDSDGSLAMSLGGLLTLGATAPPNLLHIVWVNRTYEVTGGQPLGMSPGADFAALARGAGIASARRVDELDAFEAALDELLAAREYRFLAAEVEPSPPMPDHSPQSPIEMALRFAQHIEASERVRVGAAEARLL